MTQYVVHDAEGRILRSGNAPAGQIAAQAKAGETALQGAGSDLTHWVNAGVVEARPTLTLPTTHTIAAATDWTMTGIPEGTTVLTDGEQVGAVGADETLTISFPDAGTWTLRLDPPSPHLPAECEVTVT